MGFCQVKNPDHLGSSSYISNLDGEVVQHIEYVPFGEVFLEEKNAKWNTPYLFTSKELDKETGLYYYGARYQDPKLGIFISVDPLAEKMPNYSAYVYTFNNPIKFTDPTGMIAEPPVGVDAENGAVHTDKSGSWKYDKATTTWVGQKDKNGVKSKDIGNTIELNNVNIKGYKKTSYFQGYFDSYKHINGKNPYSPYIPDAVGIRLSVTINTGIVGSFGGTIDGAIDVHNMKDMLEDLVISVTLEVLVFLK